MDFLAIGHKIKELRKQAGYSQIQLADGICTQAHISRIEKGDVFPLASTLYQISERLGVDVNYFFDIGMTPRLDYVQAVMDQLKEARKRRNYEEISEIVKLEEKNPLFFQNKKNYQALLWNKAIVEFSLKKDLNGAIRILEEAMSLTHTEGNIFSEREMELLVSMGIFYAEDGQYEKALDVFEIGKVNLKSIPYLIDPTVKTRLLYNASWTLTKLKRYKEAIEVISEAIRWCDNQNSLFLLGELNYQLGFNYEHIGNYQVAFKYMNIARVIFEIQRFKEFSEFTHKKLVKWKEEGKIIVEDYLDIAPFK